MSLQARLQTTSTAYQSLQSALSAAVDARGRLDAQRTENESVQKEFARLTPDNEVFKLVGPVLVRQEQAEARANVAKRLEFIKGEIARIEGQIKDLEGQSASKRSELAEMQSALETQQKQSQIEA